MRPGLVPIGPFVFFYIITYLFLKVKFPRVITNTREAYGEAFSYAHAANQNQVLGHSVAICANRSGKREPIGGLGFPGKPGAYERATFSLKILPYGVPIGNSVPGLRPGPALPTIIIPHPGALVKCFFKLFAIFS